MWLYVNTGRSVDRVPKGRRLRIKCPQCGFHNTFYECESKETVKLYSLLPVYSKSTLVWQCGECLGNYSLDEKTVNEQTEAQRSHKNASQPGPGTVEPKPDPEQEAELIRKRQREARQREQEAEQRRKEAQERELELYRLQAEQRYPARTQGDACSC